MDNIIAEADMDIMNLKQAIRQSKTEYAQAFWTKALRCRPICDEQRLMTTFI